MSISYRTESTEVANCGLGRRPESRTVISNDQFSKLLKIKDVNCVNINLYNEDTSGRTNGIGFADSHEMRL